MRKIKKKEKKEKSSLVKWKSTFTYVTTNKLFLCFFGYDSRIETKYYICRNSNNSITFNNRLESCLCDKEKEKRRINRRSNVYIKKEGESTSKYNKKKFS